MHFRLHLLWMWFQCRPSVPNSRCPHAKKSVRPLKPACGTCSKNGPTPDVLTFAGNGEPTGTSPFPRNHRRYTCLARQVFSECKGERTEQFYLYSSSCRIRSFEQDWQQTSLNWIRWMKSMVRVLDRPTGHYSIREIIERDEKRSKGKLRLSRPCFSKESL